MKRLLLALAIPLAVAPAAAAWTWPTDGAVLQPFTFDEGHPYGPGQHRESTSRARLAHPCARP